MAKTDENRLGILEQREYWVNLSKFKVDYAVNRPRIVDELNIKAPDVIRKVARITWDGKQFSSGYRRRYPRSLSSPATTRWCSRLPSRFPTRTKDPFSRWR
jgi:hypothetical protein